MLSDDSLIPTSPCHDFDVYGQVGYDDTYWITNDIRNGRTLQAACAAQGGTISDTPRVRYSDDLYVRSSAFRKLAERDGWEEGFSGTTFFKFDKSGQQWQAVLESSSTVQMYHRNPTSGITSTKGILTTQQYEELFV